MEYVKVRRASEDVETLDWLYDVGVSHNQITMLVRHLSREVGIDPPKVRFYERRIVSDSGLYRRYDQRISVARNTNAETVTHEVAHHYLHQDIERYSEPGFKGQRRRVKDRRHLDPHGWDFTWRLDKLAKIAREYVTEHGW